MPTTCYAWSGGKDSYLAFWLDRRAAIVRSGRALFVTFVPRRGDFRCHPLGLLEVQGLELRVPHLFIAIDPNQWQLDYRRALLYLRQAYGVDTLVTGDIFATACEMNEYWLAGILSELGLQFRAPLLGFYWEEAISLLSTLRITAVISGIALPFYRKNVLGRQLRQDLLAEIRDDNASQVEFDMCGERGEYHTTVTAVDKQRFCPYDLSELSHVQLGSVWALGLTPDLLRLKAERIVLTSGKRHAQQTVSNQLSTGNGEKVTGDPLRPRAETDGVDI